MSTEVLEPAVATAHGVLVDVVSDRYDCATPCASSDVLPDPLRGAEGEAPFGAKRDVPGDATDADQPAGFLGRRT